ncbi:BppU family phage baseplate upper protein [Clostridium perfringens]|uniref:BppU family phage baseplate upper protein n=1 Tax=Clostridium perfringens TaxID=1502 RepID=UPI00096A8975|nr:BppU family phage baseplate upper protein [Clostridium perfringens]
MKEIFINVDYYNNEGIKTIQGNNNAEVYKICISKSKVRLSLVGKTVKLGYVMAGTTKGDIIEDLNITNAEQGEITFPITNKISKKDGVYTCQLAIFGADGFLEYTATFVLTVQANIFTKIAEEIENSKDLTYIERILEEAANISEELKSNIPVARQLNIDLENQNRILNENINRADGVKNTLITTTEQSKEAATDAIEKKSQLESSITKAKEFIDGLDGSQNIPGIRMELTELQNGLKSNQALSYEGSSISAENTLEGRTEGMRIKGKTLVNLVINGSEEIVIDKSKGANTRIKQKFTHYDLTPGKAYVGYINVTKYEGNPRYGLRIYGMPTIGSNAYYTVANGVGWYKFRWQTQDTTAPFNRIGIYMDSGDFDNGGKITCDSFMLFEEGSEIEGINSYFEDIKSFGEEEQEGDKYKISILSSGKNRCDGTTLSAFISGDGKIQGDKVALSYIAKVFKSGEYSLNKTGGDRSWLGYFNEYPKIGDTAKIYNGVGKITIPDKGYIVAYVSSDKNVSSVSNVIVSEGSTPSDYEDYKEDKKDILIKEPLRGFDENTCDVMYEDNGQVKVNRLIGEKTLNGSEVGWGQMNDSRLISTMQFYINTSAYMTSNSNLICNKFKFVRDRIIIDGIEGISKIGGNNTSIWINIKKDKLTTQDITGFKEWLKDNPITIAYQLATPTVEVVENCVDIDLDTHQEKTYFNILNSLPGTLDFKVPSNIGSLVQSNAKEINNINEFINNFILKVLLEMNKDLAAIKIKNGLN